MAKEKYDFPFKYVSFIWTFAMCDFYTTYLCRYLSCIHEFLWRLWCLDNYSLNNILYQALTSKDACHEGNGFQNHTSWGCTVGKENAFDDLSWDTNIEKDQLKKKIKKRINSLHGSVLVCLVSILCILPEVFPTQVGSPTGRAYLNFLPFPSLKFIIFLSQVFI